jgi:2-keto-3-deoxy-L-rhamnonate aldolase RhmA
MTTLRELFASGRPVVGSWIQIGDEAFVEILASGPFDWLCVDLEHTTIDIGQCGRVIRVAQLAGCPTLVRLSGHDPAEIKKVLDAGADGIVVPAVNTADEAIAIVAAATYPPVGKRGVGLARAQQYGVGFKTYMDRIRSDLFCVMQIEHVDGVDNLDPILDVDGVDGFFVGPYDLSASLGHPGDFDHPDVAAALRRIEKAVGRSDAVAGIHVVEPDLAKLETAVDNGYQMIALASDMLLFSHEVRRIGDGLQALLNRR